MSNPIQLSNITEPFIDQYLIDDLRGASLMMHTPVRREVVLETNKPWECSTSGYYNLFRDGGGIRLYYRGNRPAGDGNGDASTGQTACLAESADGIHFERPAFGLYAWEGSKENNIVWQGSEGHNFMAFKDDNPACRPDERYKAIGAGRENMMYGLVSPDGIHWRRIREETLDVQGKFDSLNVVFWDAALGRYRMFNRYFEPETGVRAIQQATSQDFIHWTEPEKFQYAEGVPMEQFYTNAIVRCPGAEHLLLSFPKRFVPDRTKSTEGMIYPSEGISDAVFMSSRDGVRWDRTFMDAWARPGLDERNWTHRGNMPAVGIFELTPGEWSLYISEHYGWATNRLRRLTLRRHGIASIHAGYAGGEMITRPLLLTGTRLSINYATSAVGSVQVEAQTPEGKPIAGFTLDDMTSMFGDELDAELTWQGGNISSLTGKPVRLRFVLQDADVYAITA